MADEKDHNFDPSVEPSSSKAWLNLIQDAADKFKTYQDKCDSIDDLYSKLEDLSNYARDPEYRIFWANVQVLLPSIYSRPPVPVVVPEFGERDPVKRVTSELLERCLAKSFDMNGMDETMRGVRDDMVISGRGVAWVRYDTEDGEKVCVEYLDRKDFLHDPARYWLEVGWVARRGFMTRKQMKKRFGEEKVTNATFNVQKKEQPDGSVDPREKAEVWEIWSKEENRVVWVTEGVEEILDEGAPHLKLQGFFPCPKPAFTTLQRRSLIPVPDMVYYKDQLEEINKLTKRIHALADAIQVKGFYPGGGEIGEAVETALNIMDDRQVMVPVSNFAAFGQGGDPIVWLPIEMVANTIAGLVEMRRQQIEDVYQITGLSDIMRGATDAQETLGAQKLKSQYGSIRVHERQHELVRVARDAARIAAEIMAENFDKKTMLDLSQMEIPTKADINKRVKEVEDRVRQMAQSPEGQAMVQQNPQQAQQIVDQAAQQIAKLEETPTIEDVMKLLKDERIRPFALDIETDSTIQPDEMAEKQARAEFMEAFARSVGAIQPLLMAGEAGAVMAGGMIKFALAPYRVGRELEGMIDDFVDQAPQMAAAMQDQGGETEALAQANLKIAEAEAKKAEAAVAKVQADAQKAQMDMQLRAKEAQDKAASDQQRFALEVEQTTGSIAETSARIEKIYADIQLAQQKMGLEANKEQREDIKAAADIQARQADQQRAAENDARAAADSDRNFMASRQDAQREQAASSER